MLPTSTNFVYIVTDKASEIFAKMQEHGVLIRQPQANGLQHQQRHALKKMQPAWTRSRLC